MNNYLKEAHFQNILILLTLKILLFNRFLYNSKILLKIFISLLKKNINCNSTLYACLFLLKNYLKILALKIIGNLFMINLNFKIIKNFFSHFFFGYLSLKAKKLINKIKLFSKYLIFLLNEIKFNKFFLKIK
jgi:hypothetical protein